MRKFDQNSFFGKFFFTTIPGEETSASCCLFVAVMLSLCLLPSWCSYSIAQLPTGSGVIMLETSRSNTLQHLAPTPSYLRRSGVIVALTEQEERVSKAMELTPAEALAESARSRGLALQLDDGTRKSHSMAENTAFVTGFFKGISTRPAFAQLVASLYFVYEAMESAFDKATDPSVKALDYPELRRVPALEDDMAYYFGVDWQSTVRPTAATKEYCDRIRSIAVDEPPLLVAHMYTRYLGDLFGGQMMGGMARSSLKLDDALGTRFYEFDEIPRAKPFIEQWYARLNDLELDAGAKQRIVDEANLVFAFNIKLFDELQGGKRAVLRTMWGLAKGAVVSRVGKIFRRS